MLFRWAHFSSSGPGREESRSSSFVMADFYFPFRYAGRADTFYCKVLVDEYIGMYTGTGCYSRILILISSKCTFRKLLKYSQRFYMDILFNVFVSVIRKIKSLY